MAGHACGIPSRVLLEPRDAQEGQVRSRQEGVTTIPELGQARMVQHFQVKRGFQHCIDPGQTPLLNGRGDKQKCRLQQDQTGTIISPYASE